MDGAKGSFWGSIFPRTARHGGKRSPTVGKRKIGALIHYATLPDKTTCKAGLRPLACPRLRLWIGLRSLAGAPVCHRRVAVANAEIARERVGTDSRSTQLPWDMGMSVEDAMPRFFFHFRKARQSMMDCQGDVFDDASGARKEALSIARDFIDRVRGLICRRWVGWSIDVCNERGHRILLLPLERAIAVRPAESLDRDGGHSPARVVHLDLRRPVRYSVLTNQTRRLRRQTSMASARQKYAVSRLGHEIRMAEETARQSRELLAGSRARLQLASPLFFLQTGRLTS